MARDLKTRPKSKLIMRLLLPMLLLVLVQLIAFFAILIISGEFISVKEYSYSTLIEKTESRKNYIETEFQQKVPLVLESADKINKNIAEIVEGADASFADIQTNKELDRLIIESSVDNLVELLRRSVSNDVYLILETGDLYANENGNKEAKAALYLR
ncbi:MAG: hypothetical protein J1E40_05435, partial [Oscillospiraceae bacterium]|nr:hypothetical protein [Oscillospiraceae bacterium]